MQQQQPKRLKVTSSSCSPRTYYRAREEDASFVVVSNDQSPRNVAWLISLKEIFSKQLPKMKKDYIVSLIFDGRHQSLLCFDQNGTVVGGIAFKPFHAKRFAEIAFCAVTDMVQVRGFGTRLMTHLKEYAKRVGMFHFLTYADNHAIGYFQKQGFSGEISLGRDVYGREIKNYEDSLLMECLLLPRVDYFSVKDLVQQQRASLVDKILRRRGMEIFASGLEGEFDQQHEAGVSVGDIPGAREAGWKQPTASLLLPSNVPCSSKPEPSTKPLCKLALGNGDFAGVWEFIHRQEQAWPFLDPVPPSLDTYFDEIRVPMDLSLVRLKIANGAYKDKLGLKRDLTLMCENCKTFNHVDTVYYKAASELQQTIDEVFE